MATKADVNVRDEGTLFLFVLETPAARHWVEENVNEGATYFGDSLVVEHRYARNLAFGMIDSGLVVR